MQDFNTWLKQVDESILGRAAGQTAGAIANVPGRVAKWAGKELDDFKQGYKSSRTSAPVPSQESDPESNRPLRPIGPARKLSRWMQK